MWEGALVVPALLQVDAEVQVQVLQHGAAPGGRAAQRGALEVVLPLHRQAGREQVVHHHEAHLRRARLRMSVAARPHFIPLLTSGHNLTSDCKQPQTKTSIGMLIKTLFHCRRYSCMVTVPGRRALAPLAGVTR